MTVFFLLTIFAALKVRTFAERDGWKVKRKKMGKLGYEKERG